MLLNEGKPHSAREVALPDIGSSQFYAEANEYFRPPTYIRG
jgi:hypothetical protein